MVQKESQNIETDVVIVGYGGAGATAAITAHDNGAKVIILEKMPAGGGNTRVSAGVLMSPIQMEAVQYIAALCSEMTEHEIIERFVEYTIKNKDWIKEIGGELGPRPPGLDVTYPIVPLPCWPNVPGGEFLTRYIIKRSEGEEGQRQGFGETLWKLLSSNVERRGIKVMTDTPAKELFTNDEGQVIGVVVERKMERFLVMAKRAVILTCGGFEHNEVMKQAFLPCNPFYGLGCLGNTGDGIVMAQKVGAALWHMTPVSSPLGFKVPDYEAAFYIKIFGGGFIYVDRDGKRFENETELEMHNMWKAVSFFDSKRLCYPRMPAFAIFDDVTRRRGPVKTPGLGANINYNWSLDNSKEISKGWISQGKTIRELAKKISVDELSLENTLSKYNEFCKAGRDPDFGRSNESLEPIEEAPYYAIKLWPCLLNTQGGPRRDKEARVLNHEGKPIPRLYSAGEFGSLWGFLYEAGGNLAECLAFGRIAGQNAAGEKPW